MAHHIKVNTLKSEDNSVYMHVDTFDERLAVWTSIYLRPTYVIKIENQVTFIQFRSQQHASEYLKELGKDYTILNVEDL